MSIFRIFLRMQRHAANAGDDHSRSLTAQSPSVRGMDPQAPQHWTAQALGEAGCSSSSAASGDAHADAWAKYYKDLEAHQQQQAAANAQYQQYAQYQQQQARYQQQQADQHRQQAWATYYAQQQAQQQRQQQAQQRQAYSGAYNYGQQGATYGGATTQQAGQTVSSILPSATACAGVGNTAHATAPYNTSTATGPSAAMPASAMAMAAQAGAAAIGMRNAGDLGPTNPTPVPNNFSFAINKPQPQPPKPAPAASWAATPAPAPAASGGQAGGQGGWPPALRAWVERSFGQCKNDVERGCVQDSLKERIQTANTTGTLWSTDWTTEPLARKHKDLWLPSPSGQPAPRDWRSGDSPGNGKQLQPLWGGGGGMGAGGHRGGGADEGGGRAGKGKRGKKKGLQLQRDYQDSLEAERLDAEESAKRQKRAGRFEATGTSLASRAGSWKHDQPTGTTQFGDGDIVLDYTVQGTCQEVEKKYLRLTSAPDPRTVRPEGVLKQAVEVVRERYESYGEERTQEQYIYLWEQMKSLRQDLTLQRIRNDFTVEVYEMHARICLEFDDMVEFNQCVEQLKVLYEEGLGSKERQREFTSYRLLYNVSMQASNNISDIMLTLSADDLQDEFIRHALKVREVSALGNYSAFFKLYRSAPGHQSHVMETFADRERLGALRVLCRSYQPSVDVSFVVKQLALDEREADGEQPESFFLTDHGAQLSADGALLDCKASKPLIVDHSIAQKEEEAEKAERRKRETIPITFS